jgi:hypothetical protein
VVGRKNHDSDVGVFYSEIDIHPKEGERLQSKGIIDKQHGNKNVITLED